MDTWNVITVCFMLWLFIPVLWTLLFPGKCIHGYRFDRSGRNTCAACAQKLAARKAEEHRRQEVARQDEERRIREFEQLRLIEAENLRQIVYLQQLDPIAFENVVLQTYRNLGWEAEATKASGDDGVDGHLQRNGKRFVLQCKRLSSGRVGSPVLRDLLGTTVKERAAGGILVTTSTFTAEAASWSKDQPLTLIDGYALVAMIEEAFPLDCPVPEEFIARKYAEASLPKTCPRCGCATQQRNGRYGPFLGCSDSPDCEWLLNLPQEMLTAQQKNQRRRSRRRRRRF